MEQGIVLDEALLPFGDKAVSARIFALEDEKEIYTEALKNGQLKINHTFELKVGVPVWLCGEVVGASGLTYRYRLLEMQRASRDSITVDTLEYAVLQAITPDGKTIDLPVY